MPNNNCTHPNIITKKYVGSSDTYQFCPSCYHTSSGEETPAKKQLIAEAIDAEEFFGIDDLENQ